MSTIYAKKSTFTKKNYEHAGNDMKTLKLKKLEKLNLKEESRKWNFMKIVTTCPVNE